MIPQKRKSPRIHGRQMPALQSARARRFYRNALQLGGTGSTPSNPSADKGNLRLTRRANRGRGGTRPSELSTTRIASRRDSSLRNRDRGNLRLNKRFLSRKDGFHAVQYS